MIDKEIPAREERDVAFLRANLYQIIRDVALDWKKKSKDPCWSQ